MDGIVDKKSSSAPRKLVGTSVPRTEDLALLTGTARFIDDLRFPGMLYAKILRSPRAHARIKVDTSAAAGMPGVHAVMAGAELVGKVKPWGDLMQDLLVGDHFPFALDKVLFEGQEIAAHNYNRPRLESVAQKSAAQFPTLKLFTVDELFGGWQKAQKTHFSDGGVFDQIYKPSAN